MGMFDWYEPQPPLACPVCKHTLLEWQGTDGPCCLLVWRQGFAAPVDQRVDAEVAAPAEERQRWSLPDSFTISSHDCGCRLPVLAVGRVEHAVWTHAELVDATNAQQWRHERRSAFGARLRHLRGKRES